MQTSRFNNYWVISATIAFVILFTFLVVDIYNKTLDDEKKNHQNQQLQMAKATTQGIDFLIKYLINDIRFLRSSEDVKRGEVSAVPFLKLFLGHQNASIIHNIFITDNTGRQEYYVGSNPPDWAYAETFDAIRINKGNKHEFIITPVKGDTIAENGPQFFFQLILPIIASVQNTTLDTLGYIGYLVNFNLLLDQFIKPLKLTKDDFAWVIDGDGRLIYHPLHEEMLFFSINKTETECFDCHTSFEVQRRIIKADAPAVGEYIVIGDEPSKIMAYAPLVIQSSKWIVVISTFAPKVTENLRDKFRGFFILGFVILGVIFFFSGLVYVINAKRIRAEEARRSIEQIQDFREQLNQSSRLASIGELVDYVAHEINTPAGIISAHVDAMILGENKGDNLDATLALIKKQTKRISEYTGTLLNYSRRIPFQPEPVDLADIMNECTNALGYRYKSKRITIVKQYEETITKILADPKQLEQIFINLLNNAIDAVAANGIITIFIQHIVENNNEMAEIRVEDDGEGIPEEILGKIFTPFFSAKKNNQGTGLGLSIVRAIVLRHRGSITITSTIGKGTSVRVVLPVSIEVV